uniref:Uncharacterized protein n=1 Tax=CrAss-like virus sp. ctZ6R2 TaxID=2827629 RepID=A0A8S5RTB9_9CAUD|nr:MAG TPA: hypothetical protein [CrAss-like virus sp. ctZ6R2]
MERCHLKVERNLQRSRNGKGVVLLLYPYLLAVNK